MHDNDVLFFIIAISEEVYRRLNGHWLVLIKGSLIKETGLIELET